MLQVIAVISDAMPAYTGIIVCVVAVISTASVTVSVQSLNQSYIRLVADRLSGRLATFADTVLRPRALRDIYESVDYDQLEINADQVVQKLSNALGKLTERTLRPVQGGGGRGVQGSGPPPASSKTTYEICANLGFSLEK